jgi:hypothetical protein
MRFERRAPERSGQAVGALVGGMLLAGMLLAEVWLRFGLPLPVCRFREWTGIPCMTCGSTRLVDALLSGHVLEAAALNPLVFSGLAALALWAVLSAVRVIFGLPTWRVVLARWERRALLLVAATALAVGWVYVIWRGV